MRRSSAASDSGARHTCPSATASRGRGERGGRRAHGVQLIALGFEQQPERLEDVRLVVGDKNVRGVGHAENLLCHPDERLVCHPDEQREEGSTVPSWWAAHRDI